MSNISRDIDTQVIEGIRRRLDEQADGLDSATLSRLARARRLALAAEVQPRRRWRRLIRLSDRPAGDWLVPAGAFASVLATAVALTLMVAEPGNGGARAMDDLELLTAGEELELYENLEFYRWLQDREQTG
ncbi:MAG: hypothetical protein BMS9Abin01_0271 [Gammaproteobacteria bacterium]|nr:MAG: hypothetical protein BMS9Abin01_0271 [Gammaproteobacteria bacterium]